jgi:predicted XRE-type DNA-binding protein
MATVIENGINESSKVDRLNAELFAALFAAYNKCSPAVKDVIETMVGIMQDPAVEPDEYQDALDTLVEALVPGKHHGTIGLDLGVQPKGAKATSIAHEMAAEEQHFADQVRQLMKDKRMSQKALAEAVGVGQSAIAMMLSRKCRPQRSTVLKIAQALNVPPNRIWRKWT